MSFQVGDYAVIATKEYLKTYPVLREKYTDETLEMLENKVCKIVCTGYVSSSVDVELLNMPGTFWLYEEALGNILDVYHEDDAVQLISAEAMENALEEVGQCDGIFIPPSMIDQIGGQILRIKRPTSSAFIVEPDTTWVVPWRFVLRKVRNPELNALSDEEINQILTF